MLGGPSHISGAVLLPARQFRVRLAANFALEALPETVLQGGLARQRSGGHQLPSEAVEQVADKRPKLAVHCAPQLAQLVDHVLPQGPMPPDPDRLAQHPRAGRRKFNCTRGTVGHSRRYNEILDTERLEARWVAIKQPVIS